jgi:hypothetical protein
MIGAVHMARNYPLIYLLMNIQLIQNSVAHPFSVLAFSTGQAESPMADRSEPIRAKFDTEEEGDYATMGYMGLEIEKAS